MDKKYTWIIWTFLGFFIFAIIGIAIEIGDEPDICSEGEYARVVNGLWQCVNVTSTDTTTAAYLVLNQSHSKLVEYNINESDHSNVSIDLQAHTKYVWGGELI